MILRVYIKNDNPNCEESMFFFVSKTPIMNKRRGSHMRSEIHREICKTLGCSNESPFEN